MTVPYSDLEGLAARLRNSGKKMCLVYAASFNEIKGIYSHISKHLVSVVSIYELDETDKSVCQYYSAVGISIVGYKIEKIDVEYPEFYSHARATEKGMFHIYNGEANRFLCGASGKEELYDLQDYNDLNKQLYTFCKKCEVLYQDRGKGLF